MARIKQPARYIKPTNIVGLTRVRLPYHRSPDGNRFRVRASIELVSIRQFLKSIPGYEYLQAARGVEDPDEVLLCTYWGDEASLRAFIQSASYERYLHILSLGDSKKTNYNDGRVITVAELNRGSLPSCDIATIFTAAFVPSTEPDTGKLAYLERIVPVTIYDPPRLANRSPPPCGWILDPQAQAGRPVKKGIVVQVWAPFEPFEKQLEVCRAVKQDAECMEEQRLGLEKLRVVSMEETTWDFGNPDETDESASEPDEEAKLVERVGEMKVQT